MINRTILKKILQLIDNRPITLITGARQVGKTYLCKLIAKQRNFAYVSLDSLQQRSLAIKDPEAFLDQHPFPLIIDEIQYAPQLFEVLEARVNKQKFETGNNYGMYIITGSQVYNLMKNVTQSLAGRVSIVNIEPLSMNEINKQKEEPFDIDIDKMNQRTSEYKISLQEAFETITKGFYPELYDNPQLISSEFYADYVSTYLDRDVSQLINIKDKIKFANFLQMLASMTGQELIYTKLAKYVGVDVNTIQSWMSILVASGIVYLLQPYNEKSITKRIIKRPKVYFADTGLAASLLKIEDYKVLMNSYFAGSFMETYIVNEIRKSYLNNGKTPNLYYYRDTNQNEIDLILLHDGKLTRIECKMGTTYSKSDIKAFSNLNKTKYIMKESCIICTSSSIYPIDEDCYVLPISVI